MTIRHKLIVPSAYLTAGMLGVYYSMYQISLLQISQSFNLDSVMMGLLVAMHFLGLCLPPLFLGSLSEKLGKKGVLTISIPLIIVGALLVSLTSSLAAFIVGVFIIGAGFSVTEATMTAALCVEFPQASRLHLGLSQAFFSIGAVLSPFACEALYAAGYTYQSLYGYVAAIFLALFILFLYTKQKNDIRGSSQFGVRGIIYLFSKKAFLLFAAAMFVYLGVEECIAFFTDSYMELTLRMPEYSALALSLYWIGMIPPRLLLGAIRLNHKTIITVCAVGIAVSTVAVLVFSSMAVRLVAYCLLGVFCGPAWPVIMDAATKKYPQNTGLAANAMMSVCGLSGALMPILVGVTIVGADFSPVFITAAVCACFMAMLFILGSRSPRNKTLENDS